MKSTITHMLVRLWARPSGTERLQDKYVFLQVKTFLIKSTEVYPSRALDARKRCQNCPSLLEIVAEKS